MAPELRKRRSTVAAEPPKSQRPATKAVEKTSKVKRKAAEDASPSASKKQKATKTTTVRKSVVKKTTGAAKVVTPSKGNRKDGPAKSSRAEKQTIGEKEGAKSDKSGKPSKTVKPAEVENPAKADKPKKVVDTAAEEEEVQDEASLSDTRADEPEDAGVLLLADELDPDDEEETVDRSLYKPGQDVGKIPKVSQEVASAAKPSTGRRGVIYVGRIPHGFYEHQMRQYLSQFGPVTRLRLSRNKKTGASKHFAFVEFEDESVAEIVTKTMNNYLLFGHMLKVRMVPKDQVHQDLFKGANRRFKTIPRNKLAGWELKKPKTQSAWAAKVEDERAVRAKRAEKLKAIGYEFEAPDLKDVPVLRAIMPAKGTEAALEAASASVSNEAKVDVTQDTEDGDAKAAPDLALATKSAAPKRKGAKGVKASK